MVLLISTIPSYLLWQWSLPLMQPLLLMYFDISTQATACSSRTITASDANSHSVSGTPALMLLSHPASGNHAVLRHIHLANTESESEN